METEEFMQQLNTLSYTIERQLLQDTDYKAMALTEAGKLSNQTAQELLQNADKIYNWLIHGKKSIKKPLT